MSGIGMVPMELGPLLPAHLSEFVIGLVLAILVAFGVTKLVVPRFEAMYAERSAEIEGGINHAQQVRLEAERTKRQYQQELASSREEAAHQREEARAQGQIILTEARARAKAETDKMLERAREQIQIERDQAYASLRADVGRLATTLAGRIVAEHMADIAAARRSVDRFLVELEAEPARPTGLRDREV